MHADRVE
jgi:hypothetical protein